MAEEAVEENNATTEEPAEETTDETAEETTEETTGDLMDVDPDSVEKDFEDEESEDPQEGEQAEEPETDEEPEADEEPEEEVDVYEPAGELTQEQVESLPDSAVNEDGTVDAEQLVKQNLGFRQKMSDGTLEEAIEFYDEYGGEDVDEPTIEGDIPEEPDEYEVNLDVPEDEGVETDDSMIQTAKETAMDAGMTQEQFDKFVNNFDDNLKKNVADKLETSREEELKKLDDDVKKAERQAAEFKQKMENMRDRGLFTDEEYEEIRLTAGTAAGMKALQKVMAKNEDFNQIPTEQSSVGGETPQDIQDKIDRIMNEDAYWDQSDPEYQQKHKEVKKLREKQQKLKQRQAGR